jgi:BspA type Leucine rich repeat region (6 copies)
VNNIEDGAFSFCQRLTTITIPQGITRIGNFAFENCGSLTAITVDALNPSYSSVDGVLLTKNGTALIECPKGKAGCYTIPAGVTSIGGDAFFGCSNLTSITIPGSVTNIEARAFWYCSSLTNAFFLGNAPFAAVSPARGGGIYHVFSFTPVTVYYLPGTARWDTNFGGAPTALWALPYPLILNSSVGLRTSEFGFIVSWATNLSVVVEGTSDLDNPKWSPLATNILSWGTNYFSDPQWTNYPGRFYRVRSE